MADILDTQGTSLWRGDGATPTEDFEEVPGLTSVDPVELVTSLRDTTTLRDSVRQFKPNIPDPPEVVAEGYYDPANPVHAALKQDWRDRMIRNFEIRFSDDTTVIALSARVIRFGTGAPNSDGDYPLRLTLKPTTDLDW